MKAGEGTPPLNTFMESYSTLWRKSWKSTWNSAPQGLIHCLLGNLIHSFLKVVVGLPVFSIWWLLSPAIRLPQAVAKHNPTDAVMVFHSILLPAPSLYCHLPHRLQLRRVMSRGNFVCFPKEMGQRVTSPETPKWYPQIWWLSNQSTHTGEMIPKQVKTTPDCHLIIFPTPPRPLGWAGWMRWPAPGGG